MISVSTWESPDKYHRALLILLQLFSIMIWTTVLVVFVLHPFSVMFGGPPPPICALDGWVMNHFSYFGYCLIFAPTLLISLLYWLDICFRSYTKSMIHSLIPFCISFITALSFYRFYLLPGYTIKISAVFYIFSVFLLAAGVIAFIHIQLIKICEMKKTNKKINSEMKV